MSLIFEEEQYENGLIWKQASNGNVPPYAVYTVDDINNKYYIARVPYTDAVYPGKLLERLDTAQFAIVGEGELESSDYSIFVQEPESNLKLVWITWNHDFRPRYILDSLIIAGYTDHTGHDQVFIMRGETPDGRHPGYITSKNY